MLDVLPSQLHGRSWHSGHLIIWQRSTFESSNNGRVFFGVAV